MNAMKPQVKEEEEVVELTPEEEAMLDAAIAKADAGNFVDEEVVYAEFPKLRPR
jgi:predicted transcriptional regulator